LLYVIIVDYSIHGKSSRPVKKIHSDVARKCSVVLLDIFRYRGFIYYEYMRLNINEK